MRTEPFLVTTVAMPLRLRAGLDLLKAERAERTGHRPTTRQLILEALETFIADGRVRDGAARRNRAGSK